MRALRYFIALALGLAACGRDVEAPNAVPPGAAERQALAHDAANVVRQLALARGITPLLRPAPVRPALVRLGQALAFDKLLSGNRDISCMSCHLPAFGTGDGLSLSIGAGGTGLGPGRTHPQGLFIPRNAPPLFNLFAVKDLFWDGRVSRDSVGRYHTPAGPQLTPEMTRVFEFGALSAQPMFPVLSREEMRAFKGNELAAIPDGAIRDIWRGIMARLGQVREYRQLFEAAYPGTPFSQMTFAHASNAIAGFFVDQLTMRDTPWDRFLSGDDGAMSPDQVAGAQIFMTIRCSLCHNGPAFTDNKFHNVALAQVGPGKGNGPLGNDDFGRMNVTGLAKDQYTFRTTPLRNVELSAPYGHDGTVTGLRAFVDHYSESDQKLRSYDVTQLDPLLQGTLVSNFTDILATRDTILDGVVLPAATVDALVEFMGALTDDAARNLDRIVPDRVPSGLPVDRP